MSRKNFLITENNAKIFADEMAYWLKAKIWESKKNGVIIQNESCMECSVVCRLCEMANTGKQIIRMSCEDIKNNQCSNFLFVGTVNLSQAILGWYSDVEEQTDVNPIGMVNSKEIDILAKFFNIQECDVSKKAPHGFEKIGITPEQVDNFVQMGSSGSNEIDILIETISILNHSIKKIPCYNVLSK